MIALWVVMTVNAVGWLVPDPADKFGWGLRARLTDPSPPYVTHEIVLWGRLEVLLINRTRDAREFVPHKPDHSVGVLDVVIARADGQQVDRTYRALPCGKGQAKVPAGGVAVSSFTLKDFGYKRFDEPGEYEMRATLETAEGLLFTPAVKFRVVEPADDAVLASHTVPPEGEEAERPVGKRQRVAIQQIKVDGRTWLYHRAFDWPEHGGKAQLAYRLAELPGKCEMTVEGSYSENGPLTITYKTSPTAQPTKLVITSSIGRPWTEEDEKLWQKLLEAKGLRPKESPSGSRPTVITPLPASPRDVAVIPSGVQPRAVAITPHIAPPPRVVRP